MSLLKKLRHLHQSAVINLRIKRYIIGGRKPRKKGYKNYRNNFVREVLADQSLIDCFLHNSALPVHYGFRIDERVIEYPWVISRLGAAKSTLLDAGFVLNFEFILDNPIFRGRNIVIYNLSPENVVRQTNVSYIYGDLGNTTLKDECFDEIVCISTLEHVGMDNTLLYSKDSRFKECRTDDYQKVIREFKRLLKPGGRLFITVPYGRYQNLGWLQQFDYEMVKTVLNIFQGSSSSTAYYKYFSNGWQAVDTDACADCSYFDIHSQSDYRPDYVAAAHAVACIEMVK